MAVWKCREAAVAAANNKTANPSSSLLLMTAGQQDRRPVELLVHDDSGSVTTPAQHISTLYSPPCDTHGISRLSTAVTIFHVQHSTAVTAASLVTYATTCTQLPTRTIVPAHPQHSGVGQTIMQMEMQDAKKSPKIAIWAPSHNFVGLSLQLRYVSTIGKTC